MNYLTTNEAMLLTNIYMSKGDKIVPLQEILDSGKIPRLKGYKVRPGKVSDSIYGGCVEYLGKDGNRVGFENPPLETSDGLPVRIMVRTQRISTHDINRGEIPFKDQILATNHNFMRKMLADTIGTSQFEFPDLKDNSIVIAAENLTQIPFENVLRAYMAETTTSTSLYQHYMKGERTFCGHALPNNLIANGPLPYVMDAPSTKSETHDESISPEELFSRGVCTPQQYAQIRNSSLFAFGRVSQFLGEKGIIAVDTKTEHGINRRGEIVSQDEIWTMDSSRFWLSDDYSRQTAAYELGEAEKINPKSYSKEFARGFSKGDKGYTDEQRMQIAVRYIEGIQHLLGKRFEPDLRSNEERVVDGLQKIVGGMFN